jgi:hypothetical protein
MYQMMLEQVKKYGSCVTRVWDVCCVVIFHFTWVSSYSDLSLVHSTSVMSCNNSQPHSRCPYPQGCLLTMQQWMTIEDNCIAALKKKHRHSLSGPLPEP